MLLKASCTNVWEEFSVLIGNLNAKKKSQVDVEDERGRTEVENLRDTEEKVWHGRE